MMNIMYILFQVSGLFLISLACIDINREENIIHHADTQLTDNEGRPFIVYNTTPIRIRRTSSINSDVFDEMKQVLRKKDSFNFSEEYVAQIDSNLNKNKWIKSNNLENILKKKGIIVDLNSIVDDEQSIEFKNFLKNLKKLEKICFDNSILLFAIGEKPYYEYLEELKYFNVINYVSPYHYTKSWLFSNPTKLPVGKYGKKPFNVSINEMISDISNQYGVLTRDLAVVYFDKSYNNMNYNCEHSFIR